MLEIQTLRSKNFGLAFRKCGWSEIGAPLPLGPQPPGGRVVAMPIVKVTVKLGRTGVLI
jgi:hypothetical protein